VSANNVASGLKVTRLFGLDRQARRECPPVPSVIAAQVPARDLHRPLRATRALADVDAAQAVTRTRARCRGAKLPRRDSWGSLMAMVVSRARAAQTTNILVTSQRSALPQRSTPRRGRDAWRLGCSPGAGERDPTSGRGPPNPQSDGFRRLRYVSQTDTDRTKERPTMVDNELFEKGGDAQASAWRRVCERQP
jgi:hypothetical protein